MKKVAVWFVALTLALALAVSALADAQTKYVAKETIKVFKEQKTDSKVLKKLKGGNKILVETQSEDGKWTGILVEDPKGGQRLGWILTKNLSDEMPQSFCSHKWGNWTVEQEPTCTKAGYRYRFCKICGIRNENNPKKLGHDFGKWSVTKKATCVQEGEKVRTCKVCGREQKKAIEKTKHDFGNWKETKKATCTQEGEKVRTCKVCGREQKSKIEKVEHNFSKWKETKKATCVQEGEKARTCKVCGKEQKKKIEKTAHSYGEWQVTVEPTCTRQGERVRTCKVCDKEQKETLDMLPHDYDEWVVQEEPTCTEEGLRTRVCKDCGEEQSQTLAMLPHDYAWNVTLEATDHSAGTRARICQVCGYDGGEESFDPEGTLRRGDRSEEVHNIQQLLVDQGYLNVGGADGVFGGGTEKALMQFQQDQGLSPDGVAWPQTIKRLQHEFGPWETVKEMTRAEAGERKRVCRDCGYEQHETIEAGMTFESGRRGEDIRALQQMLSQMGYDAGSFDGIYGRKLDNAMAQFAAARGLTVEQGRIRPAELDAVVNAWFESMPVGDWMGEGGVSSPVNMALTVTPTDAADDSGVATYSWSLTNLGTERCVFTALLLTFGDTPDFKRDNLVMAVDGFELKPNCGNSVSGSFTADRDWGEGGMHFAALAVSEATGAKWLSNDVAFEGGSAGADAARTVAPVAAQVDVNALADGEYPVAFNRGDILSGASGLFMNAVHVYTMDVYDSADITGLKPGDTVVVDGSNLEVDTVEERDGGIVVNGGDGEPGGCAFAPVDEGSRYRALMLDDEATYTEQGVTTLTVDSSAVYVDASDLNGEPVTANYDGIVDAIAGSDNGEFDQYNTTVRIEAGRVVEIRRVYVP